MKKKSVCILLIFAAVIVLTYVTGESYYRGISEKAGLDKQEEKIYKYQYDMIVDSPDSQFWQAVYDSAKKKAAPNNVLIEIMGPDRETSYDKLDYMNMSIAAKADGIILQYNGEAGLEEAINTAVRNGIPVVTVMSDAVHSRRQSFVGVSDYQLGMAYGEIVAKYVDENTKKILILQKRDIDDMNESQIYTQISNAVKMAAGSEDIEIKGRNLLSTGTFETEEAVTDIFQQKRNVPDILVCMDEETTECARQAILDFNLAGKVKIIGYYTSEDILAAVEKGVISVTCDVDTTQLGQYSVEAVTSYIEDGRTNSFYNVDINFLDRTAVKKMRREAVTDEKIRWSDFSLVSKIMIEVGVLAVLLFSINMLFYARINNSMQEMDDVYASNAQITELGQVFDDVQDSMYQYLKVKNSQALMDYYQNEAKYRQELEKLNERNIDDSVKLLEKKIRKMSESYLSCTAGTVAAKRGRNVEKYKQEYDESLELYSYIQSSMDELNKQLFKENSQTYAALRAVMRYLEISNMMIMLLVVICGMFLLIMATREMFLPLTNMAETAQLVGQGNFNVKMPPADSRDELGTVTRAFNTMVDNLGLYIARTKASMEKEQQMIERELLMETHLKEAQLKYLQSQINPHFLFNSLNAGVQLAMMEDAEKTSIFVEKMADFFRYNVKKGEEDATLEEELEAVDNYIYILNVRFAGDIHFSKKVECDVENVRVPSMILQPVVENAVNHGIRNIDWEGHIDLSVERWNDHIEISVRDNGLGMTGEQIQRVLSKKVHSSSGEGDSTGIGMNNVISRLELYYERDGLMEIYSEGEGMGTEVVINIPLERSEKMYRILIADDEGIMLESLKNIISSNYGNECEIHTAKTGRVVVEEAEKYPPDICFMDIQMPGLSGIQAIREIQKFNRSVVFVIITAYDKFNYAKEAVNLGVMEFLTKPVNKKVILEICSKAMEKVDSTRQKRSDDLRIREKLETVVPMIESGYINNILLQDDFQTYKDNYRELLDIREEYGYMIVAEFGDSTENGVLTNAVGASVKANKFYSTFREIAQGFFECLVGPIMGNRIVLLVPYRNSRESYEERVEVVTRTRNMVHKLESRIDSKFRCGIGRVKEMGSTMKESFKEAMIALRESTSHVIHIEDVPAAQKYDGEYPRDLERRYEKRVMDKDVAGALSCAEEFIRWMEKQPGVDLEDMRIKILELVMGVEKKAFFAGTVKYAISCRRNYIHEIQEYTDIEGMKKWFLGKTSEICSNMESAREKEAVSIIEKAKSYIRDNYKKDISLDEVSREVDISPYYFSKLFKQETGGNFIEYLTEVRLRNARELLKDSGLSIKEICAESGYSDPNYFSRIFKKYEGVTPSEFRERLR